MNWNLLEANWEKLSGLAKQKWPDLTDHELKAIHGRRDRLIGRLQVHYGHSRKQSAREADEFVDQIDVFAEVS